MYENVFTEVNLFYWLFSYILLFVLIATKIVKENHNLSKDEIAKLQQRWRQESEWMNQLQTPYIVRGLNEIVDKPFLEYLTQQNAWLQLQPIVMEYCNGGDLRAQLLLVENTNGLIEYEVREVLLALRHAIEFLHTKCRIEHRDLKPDNIVIHHIGNRRLYKVFTISLHSCNSLKLY